MLTNIFQLPDPKGWGCMVIQGGVRHNPLVIELKNKDIKDGPVKLEFGYTYHFSGWMAWRGAGFRVGTERNFADHIRRIAPRLAHHSDRELLESSEFQHSSLFICNTVKGDQIYIVADWGHTDRCGGEYTGCATNFLAQTTMVMM